MSVIVYKKTEKRIKYWNSLVGRKFSESTKRKMRESHIGVKPSEVTRKRMKESAIKRGVKPSQAAHENSIKVRLGKPPWNKGLPKEKQPKFGHRVSEETKVKIRIAIFERVKKNVGLPFPLLGRNEKEILDKLEQEMNYKILRQFKVMGYFLDGYIPELKLAIEVDERPKDKERDTKRQKRIEEELGCTFRRINDY
jgi:hypothetical protein